MRDPAIGSIDMFGKRKMEIMGADPLNYFRQAQRQSDLSEHGIGIDKDFFGDGEVFRPQPAAAGNIDEQVRARAELLGGGFAHAVVGAVGGVPVDPLAAEAQPLHHRLEILDIVGAIGADGAVHRIVGPGFSVFEVKDLMAELSEAGHVLEIIPGHSAKRVLPDQSCNDNPHRPWL